MATNQTIAQLFGALATVNRPQEGQVIEKQTFGFAGIDGVAQTVLADKGYTLTVSGTMRAVGTTLAVAADAMNDLTDAIFALEKAGTVLNIFALGGSLIDQIYRGSTGVRYDNVVINAFSEIGPRMRSPAPAPDIVRVSAPFLCIFRKLGA